VAQRNLVLLIGNLISSTGADSISRHC